MENSIATKDLSIFIINFNTIKLTLECLRSIYREVNNIDFEIIVVDNGSTDDTLELIKKDFPNIVCIEEKKSGVSAARNTGISKVDKKTEKNFKSLK